MVATSHFVERTPLHLIGFWRYLNLGQVGVVAFFVLSGMVIPFSLKSGERPVLNFWISRFFRLYPAYWFSIALAIITTTMIYGFQVDFGIIISNMTMFQSLFKVPDLFGVYWTLIIEMFFYLACTGLFVFKLLEHKKIRFFISIVMLWVAVLFAIVRFYFNMKVPVAIPLCMSLMFFGSLWRDISLSIADIEIKKFSFIWILMFFICLIPICFLAYNKNFGHNENALSYIASYTVGIIFCLLMTTKFKLKAKLFVYFGMISYSVYLIHPFFLEIISSRINMADKFNVSSFMIYISCVIGSSSCCYFMLEKPAIDFGRKMKSRFIPCPYT